MRKVIAVFGRTSMLLLLLGLTAPGASAQVLNSGFETGPTLSPWVSSGTGPDWLRSTTSPITGTASAVVDYGGSDVGNESLSQTFTSAANTAYLVTFKVTRQKSGQFNSFEAGTDGVTRLTLADAAITTVVSTHTFNFTSSVAGSTTLFFRANKSVNGAVTLWLDEFTATVNKVPELDGSASQLPMTFILCLFLLVGDRRRRATSLA